jgi:hypothetical protein
MSSEAIRSSSNVRRRAVEGGLPVFAASWRTIRLNASTKKIPEPQAGSHTLGSRSSTSGVSASASINSTSSGGV